MYQFAEETGALPVGTNPCRAIPTFKLKRRERYLSDEEIGRLAEALEWAKVHSKVSATTIHALYVILLTGCRHSEVRTLKWDYIDFQNSCLRFPDSKTGAKVVPVGSIVLKILRDLPRAQDSEYVFPGRLPGKPLLSLNPSWEPVRKRAGLKGVTIHDLRHTFATSASADGVDLERIQKLLVHTDKRMTLSYVHVLPRPSQEDQEAAEQISQALFGRLGGSAAGG
jgi:integrase